MPRLAPVRRRPRLHRDARRSRARQALRALLPRRYRTQQQTVCGYQHVERYVHHQRLLIVARGEREDDGRKEKRHPDSHTPRRATRGNEHVVRCAVLRDTRVDPRPCREHGENDRRHHDAGPKQRWDRMSEDVEFDGRSETHGAIEERGVPIGRRGVRHRPIVIGSERFDGIDFQCGGEGDDQTHRHGERGEGSQRVVGPHAPSDDVRRVVGELRMLLIHHHARCAESSNTMAAGMNNT